MSTIQDVIDHRPVITGRSVNIIGGMGGGGGIRKIGPDEILSEAYQSIGDTIAEEKGLTLKEAIALPPSTQLGTKAEIAFQKFLELYSKTKSPSLFR